jgi:hypothetical protein
MMIWNFATLYGSNVKKYKLGSLYCVLGNIEPWHRSALRLIQLVTLIKSKLVEEYRIDEILKPFIESLPQLEHVFIAKPICR